MTLPAPKHFWNFNETSGTVANDAAGGAKMAIDRESFVPGKVGNALRFNPRDGARLATTTLPELPPPWTAAFWVKREEDTESASLFSSLHYALKLEQWPHTHQLGFTHFNHFDESFGCTAPLGEWVHLSLVGTETETRLYANGKLQGSLSKPVGLGLQWLGSTGGYVEFASVILDEVKVFTEALTDAQVAELAHEGGESTVVALEGQWIYSGRPGPRITISGNRLSVDMSAYGRPTATGLILSRSQIQVTFPDDGTFTGTLTANPDRIDWSNNTVWTRSH